MRNLRMKRKTFERTVRMLLDTHKDNRGDEAISDILDLLQVAYDNIGLGCFRCPVWKPMVFIFKESVIEHEAKCKGKGE